MRRAHEARGVPCFPPMYCWPKPVKLALLGLAALVCAAAYAAMFGGLLGLLSLMLSGG